MAPARLRWAGAALVAGFVAALLIGRGHFLALDDLLVANASTTSAWAAELVAPSGHPGVVWIDDGLVRGFHDSATAVAGLEALLGATSAALLGIWCLAAALLFLGLRFAMDVLARRRSPATRGALEIAGVEIPEDRAPYHFLVCGSPGAGKSTAIKGLLDQVRARGDRAIVYDASGEYIDRYYRPGRDVILNPLDPRTAIWTPWAEANSPDGYASLARALFPPGGVEPFWADASATLFASALESLDAAGTRDNDALRHALTSAKLEDLHEFLQGTPAARFLDPKAGAMPANLIATVTSRLEAWSLLPDPAEGEAPFSVRTFCEKSEGDAWLFLSAPSREAAILRPLLSLWADVASAALLSRPITHDGVACWVVLDELASLQRLPALPGLLSRGRKHGVAVVLGLQAMPQLRDAYGADGAAALLAQPQTWLVLRSVEPDTARWLEAALGHVEIEETSTSVSAGKGSSTSVQTHAAVRPLVLASEIGALPDFEGYLRRAGESELLRVQVQPVHRTKPRR